MAQSRVLKVVILGAPGSGKGTISTRIVDNFGFMHLSSGDLLRSEISQKSEVGLLAKACIDQGKLVPDDVMIQLISKQVSSLKSRSVLLDGFPRTQAQAEALQRAEAINFAINLDVPVDVIVDRIRGRWTHLSSGRIYHTQFSPPKKPGLDDVTGEPLIQREDDKPELVLKRLQSLSEHVAPVLDYYRNLGILTEFRGTESNEIWPRVYDFLALHIPPMKGSS